MRYFLLALAITTVSAVPSQPSPKNYGGGPQENLGHGYEAVGDERIVNLDGSYQEPLGDGYHGPPVQEPLGGPYQEPIVQEPLGGGYQEPHVPAPLGAGYEAPHPPEPLEGGYEAPHVPEPLDGGYQAPNSPFEGVNPLAPANQGQGTCLHECVPYFQCDNGEIIQDGEGIIDLRIYEPDAPTDDLLGVGGSCPNILDVCCRNPNVPLPPVPTPAPYTATQCGDKYDQHHQQGGINVRIHLDKAKHGFDNVAQFGAYPWMAAILKFNQHDNPDLNIYQCGGSLIDHQVIMTAAHCVDSLRPEEMKIRMGEWDTQSTQDHPSYAHQDYYVSKVVIHNKYYRSNVFNDIALIFLTEPVALNYHINTVCLPQYNQSFVGQTCYASGWGKDYFGQEGNWQAILKEIDIPVVDRDSCQETMRTSRLGCNFCLHDSFMCAGGIAGKDTCTGDGGSPLVCYNEYTQSYVQAGIVSWGIGCGSTIPAAYVDVARYIDWIDYQKDLYFAHGSYGGVYDTSNYYEGDQEFLYCKTHPTTYPPGHKCYKEPRVPVQIRRPVRPRPGSGINVPRPQPQHPQQPPPAY